VILRTRGAQDEKKNRQRAARYWTHSQLLKFKQVNRSTSKFASVELCILGAQVYHLSFTDVAESNYIARHKFEFYILRTFLPNC
jgi:hypothetical protein